MGWLLRISFDQRFGLDDQNELHSTLWDLGTTGIAEVPNPTLPTLASAATDGNPSVGDHNGEPGGLIAGFDTEAEARRAQSVLDADDRLTVNVAPVDPDAWSSTTADTEIVLGTLPFTMKVGAAFGHGQHPTTVLAKTLLLRELDRRGPGSSVLDFGTGTGVLALHSLAAGATSIFAIDNDPAALTIAHRNIERAVTALDLGSEVVTTVTSALPTPAQPTPAASSSDRPTCDVVVANVLLAVHRQVAGQLAVAVAPGGAVIISGVLGEQRDEAIALYQDLAIEDEIGDGDWLALLVRPMVT